MASLIKVQDETYVFMANEMERVYKRLDAVERELAQLKTAQHQPPPAQDDLPYRGATLDPQPARCLRDVPHKMAARKKVCRTETAGPSVQEIRSWFMYNLI